MENLPRRKTIIAETEEGSWFGRLVGSRPGRSGSFHAEHGGGCPYLQVESAEWRGMQRTWNWEPGGSYLSWPAQSR